jgi:putative heme-binding domain-containing protein
MTWKKTHKRLAAILFAASLLLSVVAPSFASTAGPYIKILKGGKLSAEKLGPVVKLVCSRGDAEDLGYVFAQTVAKDGYAGPVRMVALEGMADAAANRGITPDGDLASIGTLIRPMEMPADVAAQMLAVRLAGLWQVEAAGADLAELATAEETSKSLRGAALTALTEIDADAARAAIDKLTADSNPAALRSLGIAALAKIDTETAAKQAAVLFQAAGSRDNSAALLQALLDQQGGAEQLAAALGETTLSADAAKVVLRSMYGLGRTDPALMSLLSKAAGFSEEPAPLTPELLKAYSADVISMGDAVRGEQIFRRAELSCTKCHALNGAGGQVGPDLIGLGGSSPNDYLVEAVLVPEKAVKEEYQVVTLLTDEGQILTGIAKERDDQRILLKDANGVMRTVPVDSIEDEKKGGSLMPKGLANFLTRQEFLDLVKFLSDLGRPGGKYERNTIPVVRRWRVLKPEAGPLTQSVPSGDEVRQHLLHGDSSAWEPVYSVCSGELPLEELAATAPTGVVYLQALVQAKQPGPVAFELNDITGLNVWLDDRELKADSRLVTELAEGEHTLTFRVDLAERKNAPLRVQLSPEPGSTAEASIVAGQ